MRDRDPKGFDRLAGQGAAALVRDRYRDHDRNANPGLLKILLNGKEGSLGVECVKNRFDQENIHAALDEPSGLVVIGGAKLIERHATRSRAAYILRHRSGAAGGAHRSRDKAETPRILC